MSLCPNFFISWRMCVKILLLEVGKIFIRAQTKFSTWQLHDPLGASLEPFQTWCGRKVMRLATLCTNRQCCYLPLHMAVRLTPAVDSVQVLTCYSCYAIVESVWSEVVFSWVCQLSRPVTGDLNYDCQSLSAEASVLSPHNFFPSCPSCGFPTPHIFELNHSVGALIRSSKNDNSILSWICFSCILGLQTPVSCHGYRQRTPHIGRAQSFIGLLRYG